ncbi:MAG: pilus assembly protein [Alphaproteobacteria bacterium]|nr:pilus assembly protein [Alphaproteobacteria bacterium]
MAADVLVDAGFLVALLSRRDGHHDWARALAKRFAPPWQSCDAALSEALHLLGTRGAPALTAMLERGAVSPAFSLAAELPATLRLLRRYADVPMSLADACLVRMTETARDPVLLTTARDFRIYRRNGRAVVPVKMP